MVQILLIPFTLRLKLVKQTINATVSYFYVFCTEMHTFGFYFKWFYNCTSLYSSAKHSKEPEKGLKISCLQIYVTKNLKIS